LTVALSNTALSAWAAAARRWTAAARAGELLLLAFLALLVLLILLALLGHVYHPTSQHTWVNDSLT
jgi:hypothetical protein